MVPSVERGSGFTLEIFRRWLHVADICTSASSARVDEIDRLHAEL
jgi:hypothetical protein